VKKAVRKAARKAAVKARVRKARGTAAVKAAVRKATRKATRKETRPRARGATAPPARATTRPAPAASSAPAKDRRTGPPAPPRGTRRRPAGAELLPPMPDVDTGEEDDEPLVPGAPSSLLPGPRDGRARAVSLPEDEFTAEVSEDEGLRAGDVDSDAGNAYANGDETPGGDNPTPDQDVVDLIGRALGVEYEDNEELRGADKISERDRRRWELDPASAEDYKDRKRR